MEFSRFFMPKERWDSAPYLDGDEAKHLTQVLRIRTGETVVVFDGLGRSAMATVTEARKQHVTLQLGNVTTSPRPCPDITLGQAVPKGKNMDWIVQKSVELGVAQIQPLLTSHSVALPRDEKSAKWCRTALEACKQCGQDLLPTVAEPAQIIPWLERLAPPDPNELRLIASLAPGARPLREVMRQHPQTRQATVLIGPEGDFSPGETAAALQAGFLPVTLGNIVLRVETAALFSLAALRCEFG
jgi:16S rRNA (uracil1498-N3)-methyltransferase